MSKREDLDPVYRHSLREAVLILLVWTVSGIYTVGFTYLFGYRSHEPQSESWGPDVGDLVGTLESWNRAPESLTAPLGLGIPDWVFYGILLPWVACILFTFWFCLRVFREDDLSPADVPFDSESTE